MVARATYPAAEDAMQVPMLGILGGGQLGRMTAMAAIRLGIHVRTLSPRHEGPVSALGDARTGDWTDPAVLASFAKGCSAVTVESEWAPADLLEPLLEEPDRIYPRPGTLRLVRDKGLQKRTLARAGLPVPAFRLCPSLAEAGEAAIEFGMPVVLKRYRGSYDGYGNATARTYEELEAAWARLAEPDGLMVEAWVPFERELSVLVARRRGGEHVVYPVADTEQRDHRCHAVIVPAAVDPAVTDEARRLAVAAAESFDVVGVLGVELFLEPGNRLTINELAPRPHNTGHYTIEASHTSQFENHVRAVLDWPLGDPSMRDRCAVMVNVLGRRTGAASAATLPDALSVRGAGVHVYGKEDVRPHRKMGHVTVTGSDPSDVRERAVRAASALDL